MSSRLEVERGAEDTPAPTRRVLASLAFVAYATLGTMLASEIGMALVLTDVSPWILRALTIALTTTGATVASYFVLHARRTPDERTTRESRERRRLGARTEELERLTGELQTQIMERRRAEDTLRRHDSGLRAAEELAHLGSYEISIPSRGDDYWSDEMYRIVGLERSRQSLSLNAFVAEIVHPDDRERVTGVIKKTLADAVPFDLEFRIRRPDGSTRHVQSVGRPTRDDEGTMRKAIGSLLDVTERRRAEEALRTSEARAAAFLETAAETVVVTDARGVVILANERVEEMFGYRRDEIVGGSLEVLVPIRARSAHARHREEYFLDPRARPMGRALTLAGRRRDGSEFPIEVSLSFIDTDDGVLAMSFINDISDRRHAEKALYAAQRAAQQRERLADIGALTAKIVHDLGNPIAGLSMSVQRIARRLSRRADAPLESVRSQVEHMTTTVYHLDTLTHEFKTFLREQRLSPATIDMPAFLTELHSVWEPEASQRGIRLSLAVPEDGHPFLTADPDQLRRLFDNLVKNALEAVDRGPGDVTISANLGSPDTVRVSVADTGPGIPNGANVFALFETTKKNGTGLGLPIARQIAEAHDGGIEFACAYPHGTVFQVDLSRHGPDMQRDRGPHH